MLIFSMVKLLELFFLILMWMGVYVYSECENMDSSQMWFWFSFEYKHKTVVWPNVNWITFSLLCFQ